MSNLMHTDAGQSYEITIDRYGFIHLTKYGHYGENRLSPKEAADLAWGLLDAIRKSQDRNQIPLPSYYSTEAIERRMNSSLGKAMAAVRKVFQ